jgi:hypothetical protein
LNGVVAEAAVAPSYEATRTDHADLAQRVDAAPAAQVALATQRSEPAEMPSLGDVTHVVPLLSSPQPAVPSPSARSIAANLAAVQDLDPEFAQALSDGLTPDTTRASAPRVDPLTRIPSPSDARRARLLAGSLPASAMYATAALSDDDHSRERLTSRLEDRLYDSIHRVDVDGRSVSFKF